MKVSILVSLAVLCLTACSKKVKQEPRVPEPPVNTAPKQEVLKTAFLVPETNIILPVGTKVQLNETHNQVRIELPKGFTFFTKTPDVGLEKVMKTLPVILIGSYTCKCGDSDSRCSVFHLSVGGFGCLHNSCTGVCTGEFVTLKGAKIEGVLDVSSPTIQFTTLNTASLNKIGKDIFFDHPLVQATILQEHARLFKGRLSPRYERFLQEKKLQEDHVYVATSLYGVSFYMIAPKAAVSKASPIYPITEAGPKCQCSGTGHGDCRTEKRSLMGMVTVHWCEGECTACVLTV